MQSLLRRAWPQDQNDKKPEKPLLSKPKMRPSSIVELPPMFRMKRKRSEGPESTLSSGQENLKKRRTSEVERSVEIMSGDGRRDLQPRKEQLAVDNDAFQGHLISPPTEAEATKPLLPATFLPTAPDHSEPSKVQTDETMSQQQRHHEAETKVDDTSDTTNETRSSELREVIEHQVNLEILLKHRELRLIEQELAKCQVALEQLRRCEIVPYPGATSLSEAVSAGTGPSLKSLPGLTQPKAPAPWGVADGPYTRHYARWLLNDPTFDALPVQQMQPPVDYFSNAPEGRSTRNSGAGLGRSSKNRTPRDSVGNYGHALPNYPMHSRGKGGPLVIKRMADNQFVKLICNNCQRGDFSSVQGFLNHCRIAHKVDYKSHEAAATDCGRPLEEDETHLIPPTTPAAIPAARTAAPRAPAPVVQTPAPGYVHPLNAPTIPRYTWKVQAAAARAAAAAAASATPTMNKSRSKQANHVTSSLSSRQPFYSTPLVKSSTMPFLSTQFAKRGLGGNLQDAAARAREKVDLDFDLADDDEPSSASSRKQSGSTGTLPHGHPQSRKGHQGLVMSRPRPSPLAPPQSSTRGSVMEIPESPQDPNLSPHAVDSNPGLVSDHEDDDAVSDLDEARSERHASPDAPMTQLSGMRRAMDGCGTEAMDVDVEFEDDGDGHHGVLIRPRALAFQEFAQRPATGSSQRPVSRFGESAK